MKPTPTLEGRLRIFSPVEIRSQFREDVAEGLQRQQKALQPKYFYDQHGSELFEQICAQPEYYLTRTEAAILRSNVERIVETAGPCALVELGSGSSAKTRLLLDEYLRRGYPMSYTPVDISASMLEQSARALTSEYPALFVEALATDYINGLAALPNGGHRLVMFLGSNLGNFSQIEQDRLFEHLAGTLATNDQLLLGIDLRKRVGVLEAAYNDAAGVTAAFNLNILRHINRELGGDFDLQAFAHVAFYNESLHQIEMHLRSEVAQEVRVDELDLRVSFRQGETIHTEISRKFDPEQIRADLRRFGFERRAAWTDVAKLFQVALFRYSG